MGISALLINYPRVKQFTPVTQFFGIFVLSDLFGDDGGSILERSLLLALGKIKKDSTRG